MNGILHNARYAKLRRKVGKIEFYIRKITKTKEFLNSTALPIKNQCHIFFQKVIEVLDVQSFWIQSLNNIYSLICIKLSLVVRNMGIAIARNQYTFAIKSPIIYHQRLFRASEEWIHTPLAGFISIPPTRFDINVIT